MKSKKFLVVITSLILAILISYSLPRAKYKGTGFISELSIPKALSGWAGRDVTKEVGLNANSTTYDFVSEALAYQYVNADGKNLLFIIDDTQTLKRAKKMDAVGKLFHHASGKYGTGHTIVKISLYYRGVTIPWGSWLYVKKEHTANLGIPFNKLTELAADAIKSAALPQGFDVTVLFDAFYYGRNVLLEKLLAA